MSEQPEENWAYTASHPSSKGASLGSSLGATLGAPPSEKVAAEAAEAAAAVDGSQEVTLESVRAQSAAIRQRMEELRAETEAEILKNWTSPWKGEQMVATKVETRLATNAEFRAAMAKARTLDQLEAQLDPEAAGAEEAAGKTAGGHPAIGR